MDFKIDLQLLLAKDNEQERMAVYNKITRVKEDEVVNNFNNLSTDYISVILDDASNESKDSGIASAALQALGHLMYKNVYKSKAVCEKILSILTSVIEKTNEKSVVTSAIWCLTQHHITPQILAPKVEAILKCINDALCHKQHKSSVVEYESIHVIRRFLETVPDEMRKHSVYWGRMLYPLLVHGAPKLRERAVSCMKAGISFLIEHQDEIAPHLQEDLQNLLLNEMKKIMNNKQEIAMLQSWELYLNLLGKNLFNGMFINKMLVIVELAFKNAQPEVKARAYTSWSKLMDSMTLIPGAISNDKKIKLLMAVFLIHNAKTEAIATQKLLSWWHLVQCLGSKATLYMDKVIAPLIMYCVGPAMKVQSTPMKGTLLKSPSGTPGIGSPASQNYPQMQFDIIKYYACEVIALVLSKGLPNHTFPKDYTFTLDHLEHDIVTGGNFFIKHANLLITASKECIKNCPHHPLVYDIMISLVARIRIILETNKKEVANVLILFNRTLKELIKLRCLKPAQAVDLMECMLLTIPERSLASSVYSDEMHTNPSTLIIQLMFEDYIVEEMHACEKFATLLSGYCKIGMQNQPLGLGFCQSIYEVIRATKIDKEILAKFWSIVTKQLDTLINKTSTVNQGDGMDHDFTCLMSALTIPVKQLIHASMAVTTRNEMLSIWGDLYRSFARLASTVTSVQENYICQELSKVLHDLEKDKLKIINVVECLCAMIQHMKEGLIFANLEKERTFIGISSPLSPTGKKSRSLGNLHYFTKLLASITEAFDNITQDEKKLSDLLLQAATRIVDSYILLFSKVTPSSMLISLCHNLAKPISVFYQRSSANTKLYNASLNLKLEKLAESVFSSLSNHCNGLYDSELLRTLSPLLEHTFLHPRRAIKNETSSFWNTTFSHCSMLEYPVPLRPVFAKLKTKSPLILPGWNFDEDLKDISMALSQPSQMESQALPTPTFMKFGTPSPNKTHGSFLHKVSPHKGFSPPIKPQKVAIEDMNTQDFVKIETPKSSKRHLTEHQKDVLRTKCQLPAMYNTLDASQDASQSLMASQSMLESPPADETSINFSAQSKFKMPFTKEENFTSIKPNPEYKMTSANKSPAVEVVNLDSSQSSQGSTSATRIEGMEVFKGLLESPGKSTGSPLKAPGSGRKKKTRTKAPTPSKIDKWISKSPRKPAPEMHPFTVTLVEDTEQFSPSKFQRMSKSSEEMIEETPTKGEPSISLLPVSSSKKLFCDSSDENMLSPEVPIVKKTVAGSPKSSQDSVSSEPSCETPKRRMSKRRSSFMKMSKASQEGIVKNEMNLDDIIPNSQDSSGFDEYVRNSQEKSSMSVDITQSSDADSESSTHTSTKPKRRQSLRGKSAVASKTFDIKTQSEDLKDDVSQGDVTDAQNVVEDTEQFEKANCGFMSSDDDLPLSELSNNKTESQEQTVVKETQDQKNESDGSDNIPLLDLKNLQKTAEKCAIDFTEQSDSIMDTDLFDDKPNEEKKQRRQSIKAKLEREKKKLCIDMNLKKTKGRSPAVKRLSRTPLNTKQASPESLTKKRRSRKPMIAKVVLDTDVVTPSTELSDKCDVIKSSSLEKSEIPNAVGMESTSESTESERVANPEDGNLDVESDSMDTSESVIEEVTIEVTNTQSHPDSERSNVIDINSEPPIICDSEQLVETQNDNEKCDNEIVTENLPEHQGSIVEKVDSKVDEKNVASDSDKVDDSERLLSDCKAPDTLDNTKVILTEVNSIDKLNVDKTVNDIKEKLQAEEADDKSDSKSTPRPQSRAQMILARSQKISSCRKENSDPTSDEGDSSDKTLSPAKPLANCASPKFRSLKVAHVFSPSASPSAGILKRRRLIGDQAAESPSPPNKHRRVSFSDKIHMKSHPARQSSPRPVNRCLQLTKKINTSPLIAQRSPRVRKIICIKPAVPSESNTEVIAEKKQASKAVTSDACITDSVSECTTPVSKPSTESTSPLPRVEDELEKLSLGKPDPTHTDASQTKMQSQDQSVSTLPPSTLPPSTENTKMSIMSNLDEFILHMNTTELSQLSADNLKTLHKQLNDMTVKVVSAITDKL